MNFLVPQCCNGIFGCWFCLCYFFGRSPKRYFGGHPVESHQIQSQAEESDAKLKTKGRLSPFTAKFRKLWDSLRQHFHSLRHAWEEVVFCLCFKYHMSSGGSSSMKDFLLPGTLVKDRIDNLLVLTEVLILVPKISACQIFCNSDQLRWNLNLDSAGWSDIRMP